MGISKSKSAANRTAILEAATKLFRERGVEAVGVSELMREAGFTHGGFYNHFASKDALVAEVVSRAMCATNEGGCPGASPFCGEDEVDLAERIDRYLSRSHRDDVSGCELAGLVCDIQRMGEKAQGHFAQGLRSALEEASRSCPETGPRWASRPEIVARLCQMVGALVLSRTIAEKDPALADEILSASKRNLLDRLAQEPSTEASAPAIPPVRAPWRR